MHLVNAGHHTFSDQVWCSGESANVFAIQRRQLVQFFYGCCKAKNVTGANNVQHEDNAKKITRSLIDTINPPLYD